MRRVTVVTILLLALAAGAARAAPAAGPPPFHPRCPEHIFPYGAMIYAQFTGRYFVTQYVVCADVPAPEARRFHWSLKPPANDPRCDLFASRMATASWLHGDQHGCNHRRMTAVGHDGLVAATVTTASYECVARYHGTNTGRGDVGRCRRR